MSSEVKRYDAAHLRYEDSNIRYGEGCEVEVVTASDYAALEAECERLRQDNIALARNLRGKAATTGATYEHLVRERDALRAELAITRRVIDRIGQLCTTPHESKERFIRRVQSVIEWEVQALSAEASP